MPTTKLRSSLSAIALCTALSLGGCAGTQSTFNRLETAQNIASSAHMTQRQIPAVPFNLTVFERAPAPGQVAMIYIEGDGLAWLSRTTPSFDPTPIHPTALELAQTDPAANVIYMARPCQYSKTTNPARACARKYWMGARFAPEAVAAMNEALNDIKARYDIPAFHLVGYSGGGAMAALLAEQRKDVASLRTVAGNLDHAAHSRLHKVSLLSDSLNPADNAAKIANLPQRHFIGAQDKNVTPAIYDSFARAAGQPNCLRKTIVPGASHEKGWAARWPNLLKEPLGCRE